MKNLKDFICENNTNADNGKCLYWHIDSNNIDDLQESNLYNHRYNMQQYGEDDGYERLRIRDFVRQTKLMIKDERFDKNGFTADINNGSVNIYRDIDSYNQDKAKRDKGEPDQFTYLFLDYYASLFDIDFELVLYDCDNEGEYIDTDSYTGTGWFTVVDRKYDWYTVKGTFVLDADRIDKVNKNFYDKYKDDIPGWYIL